MVGAMMRAKVWLALVAHYVCTGAHSAEISHGGCSAPTAMATTDLLFQSIEVKEQEFHAPDCITSWGRVLDAGTGDHSLEWLQTLPSDSVVAVTGATCRAESLRKKVSEPHVEILVGNWNNQSFLEGQVFDVVIADYLVGAIEGHAPYYQDQILERLFRHVADGGRLYIVGMQPINMSLDPTKPESAKEKLVLEMQRVRDACILLAGHRPYREFPLDWILRHAAQAGFQVKSHAKFPNDYTAYMIKRQVAVGRNKLPFFLDRGVAKTMERYLVALDKQAEEATKDGSFEFGYDYVVTAVKPQSVEYS